MTDAIGVSDGHLPVQPVDIFSKRKRSTDEDSSLSKQPQRHCVDSRNTITTTFMASFELNEGALRLDVNGRPVLTNVRTTKTATRPTMTDVLPNIPTPTPRPFQFSKSPVDTPTKDFAYDIVREVSENDAYLDDILADVTLAPDQHQQFLDHNNQQIGNILITPMMKGLVQLDNASTLLTFFPEKTDSADYVNAFAIVADPRLCGMPDRIDIGPAFSLTTLVDAIHRQGNNPTIEQWILSQILPEDAVYVEKTIAIMRFIASRGFTVIVVSGVQNGEDAEITSVDTSDKNVLFLIDLPMIIERYGDGSYGWLNDRLQHMLQLSSRNSNLTVNSIGIIHRSKYELTDKIVKMQYQFEIRTRAPRKEQTHLCPRGCAARFCSAEKAFEHSENGKCRNSATYVNRPRVTCMTILGFLI